LAIDLNKVLVSSAGFSDFARGMSGKDLAGLNGKEKDEIKFEQVLLKTKGEDLELGAPFLDKAMVTAKILKQDQGEKIRVARFKAKSKYRKVTGHRTQLTQIEILKIV